MKHNQMRQVVFPILAAFIWGTSFVSQDICADSMGAFTFNGTRYFIAVLSLLVVIAVMNATRKDRPQPTAEEKKAVSYTHLDAEEGQPSIGAAHQGRQLLIDDLDDLLTGGQAVQHICTDTAPVSYTHLDVYKRQALHSYHSCKYQPISTSDYVIFVAEVASTCNEVLLMRHLLSKTTDKKQRAYLINHFLDQFKGTVYRQTMFAEFELAMGKMAENGEALTADALCRKYHELNKLYFGPDMISDDQIALEWARIPVSYTHLDVYKRQRVHCSGLNL